MAALVALLVEVILNNPDVIMQVFSLFTVFAIIATVLWGTMHYQCWKALPEKYRSTTPGRAVGLVFVPFYHLYWYYVTYPGLAKGLREWNKEVSGKVAHTGFKLGYGIAIVLTLYFVKAIVNLFFPMSLHLNFYISAGLLAATVVLMVVYYKHVIQAIHSLRKQTIPPQVEMAHAA